MKFDKITNSIFLLGRKVDKIGIWKYLKYLLIFAITSLIVVFCTNPREYIKDTVKFIVDLSLEIEKDKMEERDIVMKELNVMLRELRAESGADRVVYYEYHNSIENEAGIPFKFVDLVQQAQKPGLSDLSPLDNINVSRFDQLYFKVRDDEMVINEGDSTFLYKYPGYREISNGSNRQLYVNIPGIKLPVGLIVIEWYDNGNSIDIDWESVKKSALIQSQRINALMGRFN